MKLFNTLTRKKEEFKPIIENTVRMYNCGPTVYKPAHIGNYRAYLFADLLRRVLELEDYKVIQVMNITDVGHLTGDEDESGEDKIQKQADKEKLDPWTLTKKYTEMFFNDLKLLKIEKAEFYPKATEHIQEMIKTEEVRIVQMGVGTNPQAKDPFCATVADKFIGMVHVFLHPDTRVDHYYFPMSKIRINDKEYTRNELFETKSL